MYAAALRNSKSSKYENLTSFFSSFLKRGCGTDCDYMETEKNGPFKGRNFFSGRVGTVCVIFHISHTVFFYFLDFAANPSRSKYLFGIRRFAKKNGRALFSGPPRLSGHTTQSAARPEALLFSRKASRTERGIYRFFRPLPRKTPGLFSP